MHNQKSFPALLGFRVVLECVMTDSHVVSALTICLLACALLIGSFGIVSAGSFICPPNDKIVSTGDSMYKVQGLCGPPAFQNQRTLYGGSRGSFGTVVVDEWTYDLGPNRLKVTLVFHNGVLFEIVGHE